MNPPSKSSQSVDMASTILAMKTLGALAFETTRRKEDLKSAVIPAMKRITELVSHDAKLHFTAFSEYGPRAIEFLPVPVLSVAGANHLETNWTEYLAYMLSPERSGEIGRVLGPAIVHHLTTKRINPDQLNVFSEVPIGSACPKCGHSCILDLFLITPDTVVAIEQKVGSAENNWPCTDGTEHSQLDQYYHAIVHNAPHRHLNGMDPAPDIHFVYLTLTGEEKPNWSGISHAQLAEVVADELLNIRNPVNRWSVISMLIDWLSPPFGDWSLQISTLRRILNEPSVKLKDLLWFGELWQEHKALCTVLRAIAQDEP